MSLEIKNIGNCWVQPVVHAKRIAITMTLFVECTQCNVVKEVTGKPDSFLQPIVLGCSRCQDVRRLTEVTVGVIIYTAFEKGEAYTQEQLDAWRGIFCSQTPFERFMEVLHILYE